MGKFRGHVTIFSLHGPASQVIGNDDSFHSWHVRNYTWIDELFNKKLYHVPIILEFPNFFFIFFILRIIS